MTCVRLLEILPVLVNKLYLSGDKEMGNLTMLVQNKLNFKWLHDLMEWGKSSLKVVIVYWKRAVTDILNQFKASCDKTSLSTIMTIENLILNGEFDFCSQFSLHDSVSSMTLIYFVNVLHCQFRWLYFGRIDRTSVMPVRFFI